MSKIVGNDREFRLGLTMREGSGWSPLVYNNLHVVGEHAREEGTQEVASLKVTMGAWEAMMCVPG